MCLCRGQVWLQYWLPRAEWGVPLEWTKNNLGRVLRTAHVVTAVKCGSFIVVCKKESYPSPILKYISSWQYQTLLLRLSVLKLRIGFMPLFSSYTQQSALPQVPLGQILSVMCQRAGRESLLVHQGPCHTDLKSQMRSHQGNNGELSQSTRTGTFLHMLQEPRTSWILERQGGRPREKGNNSSQLPRISTSHQSQVTHPISSGMWWPDKSWMVSLKHSFMFAGCVVTCLGSLSTPENLPAERLVSPGKLKNIWNKLWATHKAVFVTLPPFTWEMTHHWPMWQFPVRGEETRVRDHRA